MNDNCTRYRRTYRDINLYVIVSDKRIDISCENSDNFKTLSGLSLVESMANELIDAGWTIEGIASLCWQNSYDIDNTLTKIIHDAIMCHVDRGNNGKI